MKVQFLGAAGTATGSRHLVTAGTTRLLIDCGLFQGVKGLRRRNRERPGIDPSSVDAVVLTQSHPHHSAYLPVLVRSGFSGPVYATAATRDLCQLLLPEAGRTLEEAAEHARKTGCSRHSSPQPLFTEKQARAVMPRFRTVKAGAAFGVGDATVRFAPAGYGIGACMASIECEGRSVLFSGDLGRFRDPVMLPPELPGAHDVVVMESTFGDRDHPSEDVEGALGEILERTFERGGIVLIPAPAMGCAHTVLYWLDRLLRSRRTTPVPVYLDSPLARDMTGLYRTHAAEHRLTIQECERVLGLAETVTDLCDSKALHRRPGPSVVIADEGMLVGGRVLHHFEALAPRAVNTVLLPGFQAPGTRGADLARGVREIKVHGEYVHVRAEVATMQSLSAHADKSDLLFWLDSAARPPQRVFLVHGEPSAADALRRTVAERLGIATAVADHLGSFELASEGPGVGFRDQPPDLLTA